jgi:hypothetical protein
MILKGEQVIMNNRPQNILFGEDVIGNVSAYPALPTVFCHACGSKLYRVYNTQTSWKYMCMKEMALVDLKNVLQTLQVEVE